MRESPVVVCVFSVLAASFARGDEGEWRLSLAGGATITNLRVGRADGTGLGFAARSEAMYGLSNTVEIGLSGAYFHAPDISIEGTALDGQTGNLFVDLSMFTIGAEVRWTPGLALARAFERTSPFISVRGGAALEMRTSQQLFTNSKMLVVAPKDDLQVTPFAGVSLGIEHRFGDRLFIGGEINASLAGDARLFGATGEVTWTWY